MTDTGRYRTKHIEVDAIRFLGEQNCEEVHAFLGIEHPDENDLVNHDLLEISSNHTFEAGPGDWIVRDTDGNFEAFTDEAFQDEFEPVNDEPCDFTWGESISTTNRGRIIDIPVHHGDQFIGHMRVPFAQAVVLRDMLDGLVTEVQQEQMAMEVVAKRQQEVQLRTSGGAGHA